MPMMMPIGGQEQQMMPNRRPTTNDADLGGQQQMMPIVGGQQQMMPIVGGQQPVPMGLFSHKFTPSIEEVPTAPPSTPVSQAPATAAVSDTTQIQQGAAAVSDATQVQEGEGLSFLDTLNLPAEVCPPAAKKSKKDLKDEIKNMLTKVIEMIDEM